MSHFVRASKYRHVYCEVPKAENSFTDFRLSTTVGEQNYIQANPKFWATCLAGGGGPFVVSTFDAVGRFDQNKYCYIAGHTGAVLDLAFNPFHDHIIASASDDTTIKVWGIPENPTGTKVNEALVDLHGHGKKVTLLKFHPTASNVLASASADFSMKIWDIEKSECISTSEEQFPGLIQDLAFDFKGDLLATTAKDKSLRIHDPRTNKVSLTKEMAHEGAKSFKSSFLSEDYMVTVGFTKQSQRQMKFWDVRKLSEAVNKTDIDQAAGVIIPHFDPDTNLLFLAGKGDGNIRYYEWEKGTSNMYPISEHRSTTAAKGVAFVPKRGLDVMRCETQRVLKLTSNAVEPLSFIVPRRSEAFQDDIFPDTFSGEASHTADEWLAGSSKEPIMMSLDPSKASSVNSRTFVAAKTPSQLKKELEEANARIAKLEKLLTDNNIAVP